MENRVTIDWAAHEADMARMERINRRLWVALKILKDRYINGICFEPLAEKYELSVRQTKNIIYKYDKILMKLL